MAIDQTQSFAVVRFDCCGCQCPAVHQRRGLYVYGFYRRTHDRACAGRQRRLALSTLRGCWTRRSLPTFSSARAGYGVDRAGNGASWSSSNAISKLLGGPQNASCASTNPVIRSLAAGGPASNAAAAQNAGSEVLYAGMAGALDGGGSFGGHLFSMTTANTAGNTTAWNDLATSPVTNGQGAGLQPRRFRSFVSCGGSA